jgi:hypothetical protein
MIISVDRAKKLIGLKNWSDERIQMKLDAIEQVIRSYTHNNFQDRGIRADCAVIAQKLYGNVPDINVGDTIQITESSFSSGLFVVEAIEGDMITVNNTLIDESHVLVTKVQYPADVIDCAVELMEWYMNYGGKVGVKSETLSRHSVTYEDSATLFMGYPVGILNGLKLHVKARF